MMYAYKHRTDRKYLKNSKETKFTNNLQDAKIFNRRYITPEHQIHDFEFFKVKLKLKLIK